MTPAIKELIKLATTLIEDDSYSFYSSAIEINTHTTSLDGEAIKETLTHILKRIKEDSTGPEQATPMYTELRDMKQAKYLSALKKMKKSSNVYTEHKLEGASIDGIVLDECARQAPSIEVLNNYLKGVEETQARRIEELWNIKVLSEAQAAELKELLGPPTVHRLRDSSIARWKADKLRAQRMTMRMRSYHEQ